MKNATKKKLEEINRARTLTGGELSKTKLTDFDDKIIAICGKNQLGGDENLDEIGFGPVSACNFLVSRQIFSFVHFICVRFNGSERKRNYSVMLRSLHVYHQ